MADDSWSSGRFDRKLLRRHKKLLKDENVTNKNIKVLYKNYSYNSRANNSCHNVMNYDAIYRTPEDNSFNNEEGVRSRVHRKRHYKRKKLRKNDGFKYAKQKLLAQVNFGSDVIFSGYSKLAIQTRFHKSTKLIVKGSDIIKKKSLNRFPTQFVVNVASYYKGPEPFINPVNQTRLRVYRCQIGAKEESCCCSCNSDAMFEVMKSLYDCYKKKDCNNCNCILCGHLPKAERRVGERRKEVDKAYAAMEGKSPAEKEKILKDLAMSGVPLPEARTPSEKEIMQKVRTELGLPPEPKTDEERQKMKKAEAAGVLVPLEGKTPAEKEQILKKQAELGIPLPEGRTPSEKALIQKVKAKYGVPAVKGVPTEKLRRAKAAGLLTPLEGKTKEQKEKILKGLAMAGIPLPEPKTESERQLMDKVRNDVGLPPEPTTAADKEKYKKAAAAGVITPLEGKTPQQKEKILKAQYDMGLPLPEGRTASEKALIAKIKSKPPRPSEAPVPVPSEKLRRAKAAGLITPLEGKTPEQKEKILKGLAMHGIPLPEGKTASEKKLIDKVRAEVGLPPEPKTAAEKKRYNKALAAGGIITPLEGKTKEQKEKILKAQHDMGLPLPEGRTASEKALIAKIKATPRERVSIPSEKLRQAKAAGLITPLAGKTPEQKEKIIRGLAMHGLPLPEAKTPSEKKLIDKVRADLGLPPEPKTESEKQKYNKALAAGIIQPLEGKSLPEKERILKAQHDMGLPLPEGRTASEKALIAKIKASPKGIPLGVPSEKIRKAKAAGLLTPLEGKTPEQKEKILKGLAMHGIPLPDAKTPSEKKIMDKVRAELGLPPEPKTAEEKDKYNQAVAAGIIQPLEGKSGPEKEKLLKAQHDMGIPLPEGRTPSEKALIAKVKAMPRAPPGLPLGIPSEKIRKAKAAGLITPLTGKTPEQKEKIVRGLAMAGLPLPEGKTPSEKKLIDKVRAELGLPPEPKSAGERDKYNKAVAAGIIQPLEGKSGPEKEKILKAQHDMGIPLPEGRTPSEKALIEKIKASPRGVPLGVPSEKFRKAKAAGLITPLAGKTPEQKEKILKGLAMHGIPLPEGQTPSEKKLIDKVRADLGLPPEPKTQAERDKYNEAVAAGLIQPLEGKSGPEKEKILKAQHDMGLPLPEGRTPSEKALIAKVKAMPRAPPLGIPSEKMRKAKAAGLITPLTGKTPEQKEKIVRGLAMHGLPLPEAKTPSERKLIDKVRAELGLPPEPKSAGEKEKYNKALAAGIIQPLEGKSGPEKEKILKAQHDMGIPLPEGRTPSEKALIEKIKASPRGVPLGVPSEKIRKAKAAGLITPLTGKTPEQKEKILKGLAMHGIPLPEGQSPSEKKLIDKVRADLGLPPEPKTQAERDKYNEAVAAGIIQPLEGKSGPEKEKILKAQHDMGLPLPEGRTPSEKALIAKVKAMPRAPPLGIPSEKMRKAKAAGLITPLTGKTPEQKEKIVRGLAMHGLPLPEAKTPSERKLIDKVRAELGLPPEPKSAGEKDKYNKALAAGIIQPLEGKSGPEKEKILKAQHDMGIPLPEGRTPSEKALIEKIKASPRGVPLGVPSEKIRKAKAAGLITPLAGKTPEQKEKILKGLAMHGIPLPEGQTPSEKKLIDKVRADLGLPPEPKTQAERDKYNEAVAAGIIQPLEGKSGPEKEKILKAQHDMGLPLPEGRTPSEKALIAKVKAMPRAPPGLPLGIPSEKMRKAKAAGLITPLTGKTPEQKEKIVRGLAMHGLPLPEAKTPSERKLIDKVRAELGLPPEPKSAGERDKYNKAVAAGIIQPLEGKSGPEKEKILKAQHDMGIPLPEGRTPSEKALIEKIKASPRGVPLGVPSEKIRKAKAAGLITPLAGKTPEQKEKILKGLAMHGIPLPEGQTPSEKKLIDKVRADLGLPPEPKTQAERDKYNEAVAAGIIQPLEGKSGPEKEKILKAQHDMGLPLPEGRTPSEKALIAKVKAMPRAPPGLPLGIPSEKMRKAKAAGLITPLTGKTPEQKEKIVRGLAMHGLPLPEAKTPSERKLIDKVRAELGLPPEPKSAGERDKYNKAVAAGIIQPLEGKSGPEKEKILKAQHDMGIPLPEGRTPSEKALIEKIKASPRGVPLGVPSEKIRKAKAAGLITPLTGKTPEQKEKILKGLAMHGIPLPEGQTPSEKKLIDKVRADLGLPPEPKTQAERDKYNEAVAAGIIQPLEGKSGPEKEKILKAQHDMGLPLPEGRTPSEKALIAKVKAMPRAPPLGIPSEKMRKAKAAGLITPLTGKTPEQKEKIVRGLAMHGLPLPEAKTPSERKLIDKVRAELGLPPEPKSAGEKEKYNKALAAGIIQPLEGKSGPEKEKILKAQHDMGIPLPEGRTPSEKALIEKIKASPRGVPLGVPSEKIRKAKAAGLITPLTGKTPEQKEKILKGLAMHGIPLPEGQTPSEKKLIDKVRADLGLPPEPKTQAERDKYNEAVAAGIIQPLEGKSGPEKEKILKAQHDMGLPLPEGRTPSEKALIAKVKAMPRAPPLGIPSEKMRKAKAAGLITPLTGKTPEQKEKIVRGLAMHGLPLPEAKTPSERKLIDKVRAELGLPPEPKTAREKEKYNKALAAGIIQPLEGKSLPEKEKILKAQHDMGLPLPEGRTQSEKDLIAKIKASPRVGPPSVTSEKLRKAKAAGLLTPLQGKTPAQKEKILRGLAESGLPLPEGKTPSEKSMIRKIKAEMGIPPEAATPSEKELIRKAKAEGLLTPLTGKTPEQKEKIIRGLAAAGLPIPEGRTPSEKELIKKIRKDIGLPPEPTPSEKKEKIRRKSKRVGVPGKAAVGRGIGVKPPPGVTEEFEDIIKTTKCDRACGCDKKKIRFKHSYVKIKVTSPDISSLCPCPDECYPVPKPGVSSDAEGIHVTIGRATGIPSYSAVSSQKKDLFNSYTSINKKAANSVSLDTVLLRGKKYSHPKIKKNSQISGRIDSVDYIFKYNDNFSDSSDFNKLSYLNNHSNLHRSKIENVSGVDKKSTDLFLENYLMPVSTDLRRGYTQSKRDFSQLSFQSIVIVKTDSSLNLSTKSLKTEETMSIISFVGSSFSSNTSHYFISEHDAFSVVSVLDSKSSRDSHLHAPDTIKRHGQTGFTKFTSTADINHLQKLSHSSPNDVFIFKASDKDVFRRDRSHRFSESDSILTSDYSCPSIAEIINKLLLKKQLLDSKESSMFLLVPTSDECDTETSVYGVDSTICIELSKNLYKWDNNEERLRQSQTSRRKLTRLMCAPPTGLTFISKGKGKFSKANDLKTVSMKCSDYNKSQLKFSDGINYNNVKKKEIITLKPVKTYKAISVDTIRDRPCLCLPKEKMEKEDLTSVASEIILTPLMTQQRTARGKYSTSTGKKNSISPSHSNLYNREMPIGLWSVPSCKSRAGRHFDAIQISKKAQRLSSDESSVAQVDTQDLEECRDESVGRNCPCPPEKLKELFERTLKELEELVKLSGQPNLNNSPNSSSEENMPSNSEQSDTSTIPDDTSKLEETDTFVTKSIGTSDLKKSDSFAPDLTRLKRKCTCKKKEKQRIKMRRKGYVPCLKCAGNIVASKSCQCCIHKRKKRKHKHVCRSKIENPEEIKYYTVKGNQTEIGPIIEIDYGRMEVLKEILENIDRAEIIQEMKMKSGASQATSGFNMKLRKRPELPEPIAIADEGMCFQELQYDTKPLKDFCSCSMAPLASPPMCPTEEPAMCPELDGPSKGFKLAIGAKGSGTKGLAGVLCFDKCCKAKR